MWFLDRQDAGRQLASELKQYAGRSDVVVLGVPRGGIPVAFEIASHLHAPLDIFLSRKLGVPGQEELAFGALAAEGGRYLDENIIRVVGITAAQVDSATRQVQQVLKQRSDLYRKGQPPLDVRGKTVILVDDGIATGASVFAAIHSLHPMRPAMLILATPVMPASTRAWLQDKVDKLVCLYVPDDFRAVGQFYSDFNQTSDEEVIALLSASQKALVGIPGVAHLFEERGALNGVTQHAAGWLARVCAHWHRKASSVTAAATN